VENPTQFETSKAASPVKPAPGGASNPIKEQSRSNGSLAIAGNRRAVSE